MSFRRDPHWPGKIISTTWNGTEVLLDETPALRNALHTYEMQAGMRGARALGDHGTLADFLCENPSERNSNTFRVWATRHQMSPRQMIAVELEARAHGLDLSASAKDNDEQGMTFHPGMKSHTFHPSTMAHTFHPESTMAEGTEADPLDRQNVPLADDDEERDRAPSDSDIDSMTFSPSISLRALQKAGIVHSGMTEDEFDARLKRVHIQDVHARMRLAASALEAGFFGGQTLEVPRSPIPASPNGDTLSEHRNMSPLGEMTRAGRIANIQANLDRVHAILHPHGRTIRARSERC